MDPRMTVNRPLRIAVADDERDMREYFQTILPTLGHEVVTAAGDGRELVEGCRQSRPDLVIADIRMPGMDGIEALAEVNRDRPVPGILVTAFQDPDLLTRAAAANVQSYLIKPIKVGDLFAAIQIAAARFKEHQAAVQEADHLRQALEERKVIERAKGAVMRRLSIDEAEAFRRLRKQASDHNQKLADVARLLLNAEEVFHALDAK